MYDARNLKPRISVSETRVECPVKGCLHQVTRQRSVFRRKSEFQCPQHKIFISPSTFEYPIYLDNLLWKDNADIDLLKEIKKVKRESRMARDNSEDALSWNVFRYLEKTGNLSSYLSLTTETDIRDAEIIYWSYSQRSKGSWPALDAARDEFGETRQRGSEPDLIVVSKNAIFFIEAKLTATNNTMPSDPDNLKKYVSGADQWYQEVFISNYESLAIKAKKYELLRFWLLGSWIATQSKCNF